MNERAPDVARLQAFDDQEWLLVERQFVGRLLAYVARRVPDPIAREDVVQETFLGAVRGIGDFDPVYTFEQYLFGICKNRTIDWLRRNQRPLATLAGEEDEPPAIDRLAAEQETPSRIVRRGDALAQGQALLVAILRDWVQETWQQSEFVRLMVIEALFSGRWRNRDTWQRFGLRDETAVAGIKFRALKRLRQLAAGRDLESTLLPLLAETLDDAGHQATVSVESAWREGRVSCPARHWLARSLSGALAGGPQDFLRFHLDEMRCEWCAANADDLAGREAGEDAEPLLERVGQSTLQYLRSRTRA